ncbi:ORF3 [torque teno Delphinidae virus 23]
MLQSAPGATRAGESFSCVPFRSPKTASRPSGDPRHPTGSEKTESSTQWTAWNNSSPPRNPPVPAATAQKTEEPATPEECIPIRFVLLPRGLPASLITPIPLPFSMNIHQ